MDTRTANFIRQIVNDYQGNSEDLAEVARESAARKIAYGMRVCGIRGARELVAEAMEATA